MIRGPLVVVGASLAGLRAVESARQAGFDGPVTLIGAEPYLPYDRPPLSKAFLDPGAGDVPPVFPEAATLCEDPRTTLRLGAPATALDPDARTVTVGGDTIEYGALVVATGARARTLPGAHRLAGVHSLRTVEDALAIRRLLDCGARTVVVGGGFIGAEVASAARRRGVPVTVVEAQPVPMARAIGPLMGRICAGLHAAHGTDLRCGVSVTGFEGGTRIRRVLLSDGSELDADLVVVGAGVTPATDWLAGSGMPLDDGVLCDETLATGLPDVYAAGDVARWRHPGFGRRLRLEHWTNAAEQGAIAGRNAVGAGPAEVCETVPYFWSDWYGQRLQFVGVPDSSHVEVVGDPGGRRFAAFYREGDRLAGALVLDRRPLVRVLRKLIRERAPWSAAMDLAAGLGARTSIDRAA